MKVLITTDWFEPDVNGVVTSVLNLRKELQEQGHEVRILTLSKSDTSYINRQVYYLRSIDIHKIYPNARAVLTRWDSLIKELIDWNPDVIHSQCEFMTFRFALRIKRRCGCPLIHTYHTIYEDYTHYFSPNETFGREIVALWSRRLLKKADAVVAPTQKVYDILQKYEVDRPVTVIPTGIDLQKYAKKITAEERRQMRKNLQLLPEDKVLVNVGRLAKEKNIEEIFEFLRDSQCKTIKFLLVGDGPYREELEKLAVRLGINQQVIFTGMIPPGEVANYYQLGDVFVSASNSETQGLTYIEALSAGLPALCKRDSCLQDVIYNGYNGFQYESKEEFLTCLRELITISTYREQLGENARVHSLEFSTWKFADKMMKLYRKEIKHVSNQYDVKSAYRKRAWSIVRS